jgi:hypothetical protein
MIKPLPLLLAVLAALPCAVRAADFDPGMNVRDAAAAAPAAPAPVAVAQNAVSPERAAELLRMSSDWQARKADALSAVETLVANKADGANADYWRKAGTGIKTLAQGLEDQQDRVYARASERAAAEEKDSDALKARRAAIAAVRDLRKLAIYGSLVPSVVNEAVRADDGRGYIGGLSAGPRWKIVLTMDEQKDVVESLMPRTGFSSQEWDAMDADRRE